MLTKCPACAESGKVASRLTAGGSTCTLMGWYPFYVEGVEHRHDPNRVKIVLTCENGHRIVLTRTVACSAPGCEYGREPPPTVEIAGREGFLDPWLVKSCLPVRHSRIFIYDDLRTMRQAFSDAGFERDYARNASTVALVRPFRHNGMDVVSDHGNAIEMVTSQAAFDLWILDNDLAPNLEGFEFLKMMLAVYPEKAPSEVKSCSANRDRRIQIESYFSDWERAAVKGKG